MSEAASEKLFRTKEVNGNPTNKNEKDVTCCIIGDYGRWQLGISIIMGSLKLSVAWIQLGIIFLAPPMNFWCKKPDAFQNYSDTEWATMSKPKSDESSCRMYDNQILLSRNFSDIMDIPTVPCTEFEYDLSMFTSTIVTEWNLVCSRKYYVELTQVSLMFGVLIGNVLFGLIADRYGRRKPLIIAIGVQAIFGFASAMSPNLPLFLLARFILALACGGIATVSFVMTMEVVGGIWKIIIPILYQVPFGLGSSVMAGLAYSLRDWRHLQIAISLLSCIYLVAYFFVQESPRWLLATQQYDEAIEVLEKIAKFNGRESTTIRNTIKMKYQNENQTHKSNVTFKAVLQSRNMRNKTLILFVEWFIGGLCVFAINQHVGLIGKNIFLNLIVGGFILVPASLVCIPLVKRFGCKMTIIAAQLVTALSLLVILLIPLNQYPQDWPRVVIAGIGGFGLSVALPALFLYTGELYPTVVRNAGIGCTSMFSRIGSMLSPFIVLLKGISPSFPFLLLSALIVIQTIFLCFLPDMKGCPLLDTIQQAEEYDRNKKSKSYHDHNKIKIVKIHNNNEEVSS